MVRWRALEIRCVVRAAMARVSRDLRIGEQWAGADDFAAHVGFYERLAHDGHVVNAQIGVIDDALPILPAIGVERETAAAAFMPRVRRPGGEPACDRAAQAAGSAARESAAAISLKASVPIREREPDPDLDAIARRRMRDNGGDTACRDKSRTLTQRRPDRRGSQRIENSSAFLCVGCSARISSG